MILKPEINKVLKIIFNPFSGWRSANFDDIKPKDVYLEFSIIAIILFFVRLIGKSLKYLPDTDFIYILTYSLTRVVVDYTFFIIIVYAISALLPFYSVPKDKTKVSILCLISLMPFYSTIVILNLFSTLWFFSIVLLYSFVVYFLGIKYFLKIDKDNLFVFFVLSSLIVIGLYFLLIFVLVNPFFNFVC